MYAYIASIFRELAYAYLDVAYTVVTPETVGAALRGMANVRPEKRTKKPHCDEGSPMCIVMISYFAAMFAID